MIDNTETDPNTYWIQYTGNTMRFWLLQIDTYYYYAHSSAHWYYSSHWHSKFVSKDLIGGLMMSGLYAGFGFRIYFSVLCTMWTEWSS